VLDDPSIHSALAGILDENQFNNFGTKVEHRNDLISAIQEDPYSIGICKVPDIIDTRNQNLPSQVELLPIDNNGNGQIDYKENIYGDLDAFSRGVWIGKYPRALSSNIYSVSASQPTSESEVAFLKWVLTDGQRLLDNHRFTNLEQNERIAKVKLIDVYNINTAESVNYAVQRVPLFHNIFFLTLLALIAMILFVTVAGILVTQKEKLDSTKNLVVQRSVFNEDLVESPPGLYFDLSHTWAFMETNGMVRIGIDDFLQHVTGPLTRVKMKEPGVRIKKGRKVISIIQDGKQLDICSPISGIIREKNNKLISNSLLINSSPYSEGWIYMIEPSNWIKEIQYLFMWNKYREWLANEFSRLKEFLNNSVRYESVEYAHVLQDGGELEDRILENLGPEIWEEFQTNFIEVPS
jgi:glycine cleavage system H lipoate-binding protein